MSLAREVDRWEQPALLGPKRAQVQTELTSILARVRAPGAESGVEGVTLGELEARILLRLADVQRLRGALPLDMLGRAGALAAASAPTALRVRVQLLQVRVLANAGRLGAAQALLEVVRPEAASSPGMLADLGLATAATGHPDARRLWLDALETLKQPSRDADRLEAMAGAAEASLAGEDAATARTMYRTCLTLAEAHGDEEASLMLALRLGTLLLHLGQQVEAAAPLRRALELGQARDDSLVVVTAASLLGGLALDRADWPAAEALGAVTMEAARPRRAWLAVADGAITVATARMQQARLDDAIKGLLRAAAELRRQGAVAGLNLVKARLAELRHAAGAPTFDAAMKAAMKR